MNTFGIKFKVSIFGESHGPAVGAVIDGCPAGIHISQDDFIEAISRRRGGTKKGTTPRAEADMPEILSGICNGVTTGFPIAITTRNSNTVSSDYDTFKVVPRPGHADFVALKKFSGYADMRGSGHFSGRITFGLVVAGVLAKKIVGEGIKVQSEILSVGGRTDIEKAVEEVVEAGDSLGGLIECRVTGVPVGLGEPFFYSVESAISHIVFSVPATKGIEFGSGFAAAGMRGSEHNDPIVDANGTTLSNNAGGINGGITNGNEIIFRVAIKPTSSISITQNSFNMATQKVEPFEAKGRHDSCIALRMPVVLESATYIALADLMLVNS
jgi:chorismate synthase